MTAATVPPAGPRWDMRTRMVIVSASGALPMLIIAVISPTFLKPGALPVLSLITFFTAVTVLIAAAVGRLTDRQFTVLGAGGMLGVATSAYVIADPAATRSVTAMLAIVPAIAASGSPPRVTTSLTALSVVMATIVTATDLAATGPLVSLIAIGAAVTTVLIPVTVISGLARSLRTVNLELQALADTDPLTGLLNRRGMLAPTRALLDAVHRRGTGIRAAVIDIDHFKQVNDTLGHTGGDRVLIAVANTIGAVLGDFAPLDSVLARIGGEEFLVLVPADLDQALERRILGRVRADTAVTASIGTVTAALSPVADGSMQPPPSGRRQPDMQLCEPNEGSLDPVETVIDIVGRTADGALYHAKTGGRDRAYTADPVVVTWPPAAPRTAGTRRRGLASPLLAGTGAPAADLAHDGEDDDVRFDRLQP
ncbi:GGDEF domain-containing protein [Rhodococcus sp. NPDC057297]|uniref:GGDEF domain-containing protein n=1 Tax=Rhodococcus sp. NPDC057297 TaxID=3346090 RepID=UPI003644245E